MAATSRRALGLRTSGALRSLSTLGERSAGALRPLLLGLAHRLSSTAPTTGRVAARIAGLLGGVLVASGAKATELPEQRADAMFHVYDGGGVRATGPALLVRKTLLDRVSLSGQYYMDMVSNASIDVVTTASPYKETRHEYSVGLDYVYRNALMTLGLSRSDEPDYTADTLALDLSQEVFGGMTTVNVGFSRAADRVLRKDSPEFRERATHWRYRLGATQVLTPRWLASINTEIVADDGFLGSPYRAARVFGAAIPERVPNTRTSRAIKLGVIGDIGSRNVVRADYRYFWDTWDIRAHTLEAGYSRYFGDLMLVDGFFRVNKQDKALFYSDNAAGETTYVSRNRQLGTFTSMGVGAKATYLARRVPGKYELRVIGAYEFVRFKYDDFTDVRSGGLYSFNANLLQLFVSASY